MIADQLKILKLFQTFEGFAFSNDDWEMGLRELGKVRQFT